MVQAVSLQKEPSKRAKHSRPGLQVGVQEKLEGAFGSPVRTVDLVGHPQKRARGWKAVRIADGGVWQPGCWLGLRVTPLHLPPHAAFSSASHVPPLSAVYVPITSQKKEYGVGIKAQA
jgi:hypothetical protein